MTRSRGQNKGRRRVNKKTSIAITCVGLRRIKAPLFVAFTLSGTAVAEEQALGIQYELNIPRQSLDHALKDLAQQTGLQVGRFSDAVNGDTVVGPLNGRYSAHQALEALLEPSGLAYR
jgi:hypothetical protein